MLATASLGAIWSSCSPDFGTQGVVDRFSQIEPKILFAADGYLYEGRRFDSLERLRAVASQLPTLEHIVVIPYLERQPRSCRSRARAALAGTCRPLRSRNRSHSSNGRLIIRLYSLLLRHDGVAEVHRPFRRAASFCSTSRSTCCTAICGATTYCSISRRAAG